MPGDDGLGLYEDERRPPSRPDAREPDPEQAVGYGQARSARTFQHQELVPQCEHVEVQRRACANQRTYRRRTDTMIGITVGKLFECAHNLNESGGTGFLVGTGDLILSCALPRR